MSLFPGDIIACGTNAGLGPMEHNDIIEVSVENIGIVTNKLS
jgi:2-keto-4-pentenoate hydratase/2-oxohepta-3-ene-1,7-dioic acid hydratase in catechol pathway